MRAKADMRRRSLRGQSLEKLAVTDKTTLAIEKAPAGKIRVTSSAWPDERVILKGQVLEVRMSTPCCASLVNLATMTIGTRQSSRMSLWAGQSKEDFVIGHGAE
jgi:hypothetical protein